MRASSLPLLTKCTGSLVLPCDYEKSDNAQTAADWGTMVHHWVQTGEVKGNDKRSENALRKAIELSGVERLSLWPDGGHHEGGLSLRVGGTAREASRDATPRDGWITGHFDYQWWLWGGELWVDDLKTGKFYANPEPGQIGHAPELEVGANRFPPRATSEQQRFYGLTLSRLLGYRGPVHTSVTHWPRLPLTHRHAPPTRTWHKYSRDELSYFYRELESMYQSYKRNQKMDADLELNPGEWCKFCPARSNCLMA
jgi:hypothetical protein